MDQEVNQLVYYYKYVHKFLITDLEFTLIAQSNDAFVNYNQQQLAFIIHSLLKC